MNIVDYVKTIWVNKRTALNASRMNNIEHGIADNREYVKALDDAKLDKTEAELFAKKTDIPSVLPADGGHADRATCDGNGNDITETYETKNGTELTRNMLKAKYFCGRTEEEEVYVGMLDSGLTGLLFQRDVIVPYGDIEGYAKKADIPTNISALEGDSEHRTVTDEQIKAWDASVPTKKQYVFTRTSDETYVNDGEIVAKKYNGVLYLSVNISTTKLMGEWDRVEIGQFSDWDLGYIHYYYLGAVCNLVGNYAYLEIGDDGKVYFVTHNASAATGWVYANIAALLV